MFIYPNVSSLITTLSLTFFAVGGFIDALAYFAFWLW